MTRTRGSIDAPTVATVVSTALGLQIIRVFIALLYGVRESNGSAIAVGLAVAVFAAPIGAAMLERLVERLISRPIGPGAARVFASGGLALAALGVQVVHPVPWWLGAGATAIALVAWTVLLHDARSTESSGGADFALAFLAGMALDTGIHAAFGTWDPMWRSGWVAALPTVVLTFVLAAAVVSLASSPDSSDRGGETRFTHVLPIAGLGPFLVLQLLFLHNVAFVNSVTGMRLATGTATVLAGEAIACASVAWSTRWAGRAVIPIGALALALLAWTIPVLGGFAAVIAAIGAAGLAGGALSIALSRGNRVDHHEGWRTAAALSLGTVTFAAMIFQYQIHTTSPLPFTNRLLPPLAALLLGAASIASRRPDRHESVRDRRLVALPLALLLTVPMVLLLASPVPTSAPTAGATLRILSWNVHSAVDADGQAIPDVVANEIAAERPDVVVLQEVSRGWPIGGALDLALWLSSRLEMPFVWGPAADVQFGNLVLSRVPIVAAEVVPLPFGAGPQQRSMVHVVFETTGGQVTIVGAHLGSGADTGTRTQQIQVLLDRVRGAPRTVIAGDMNMQPTDTRDVALFIDAGFVSAQDEAGAGGASTARDPMFLGDRPDWIFASSDLALSDFEILPAEASDHRPLVATITS